MRLPIRSSILKSNRKLLKTLLHNSPGWNGFYNGYLMPGSDYWFLALVKKDGIEFEVKGHFALKH